ncbi:MAG: endonuclease/exonuclease/phosphatase family protein [Rhodothermales bacterium]
MIVRVRKRRRRPRIGYAERKGLHPEYVPYVSDDHVPDGAGAVSGSETVFKVATYNVHRWSGVKGGLRWHPDLATSVIAELDADVMALQEVLRPFHEADPLRCIADRLHLHYAFSPTRRHRLGVLGNAILSRWPMQAVFTIDLSVGRLEPRSAIAAQFHNNGHTVAVVATHLAIVDRIRGWQVRTLLDHPVLEGSIVLLGDMNAWRRCRATRKLEREFAELHHNRAWPPSFPVARPVLALDRIYARGAQVSGLHTYTSAAALRGSDHLPVHATVTLDETG